MSAKELVQRDKPPDPMEQEPIEAEQDWLKSTTIRAQSHQFPEQEVGSCTISSSMKNFPLGEQMSQYQLYEAVEQCNLEHLIIDAQKFN